MPTTYPVTDSASGVLTTVNDWIKDPMAVQAAVIQLTDMDLIPEAVLRNGGQTASGVVKYFESTPLFSGDGPTPRQEFDEPSIARATLGQPYNVSTEEFATSVLVSEEMRRRMVIDPVITNITQATNTYKRWWSDHFRNTIFNHPRVQSYPCTNGDWDSDNATIRKDILAAKRLIKTAAPDGMDEYSRFGYAPDTLIVGEDAEAALQGSDEFAKVYQGNIADQNVQYTGVIPNKIFGLDVLIDRFMPPGKAIMMQRQTAGAYVDEVPFEVGPLHEWTDHYSWRANIRRSSVVYLDAPKSVCVLTGVTAVTP